MHGKTTNNGQPSAASSDDINAVNDNVANVNAIDDDMWNIVPAFTSDPVLNWYLGLIQKSKVKDPLGLYIPIFPVLSDLLGYIKQEEVMNGVKLSDGEYTSAMLDISAFQQNN